jgi:multicomponent Na+:H+ antiporter subunit G
MNWLLGLKILLIINFIFIGSPTATHAMMDAGNKAGAEPWKKDSE